MRRILASLAFLTCLANVCLRAAYGLDFEQSALLFAGVNPPVLCNDESLHDLVSPLFDDDLFHFESELKKEFTLSWTEENLSSQSKAMLAGALSPLLSSLLPCRNVIFSRPTVLQDGSKSFRFKDMNRGEMYAAVCKDGRILSLTLI